MTKTLFEKVNWRRFHTDNVVLLVLPDDNKGELIAALTTAGRCRTANGLKPSDDAEFCNRLQEAREPVYVRYSHGITSVVLFTLPGDKIVRLRKTFQAKIKEEA